MQRLLRADIATVCSALALGATVVFSDWPSALRVTLGLSGAIVFIVSLVIIWKWSRYQTSLSVPGELKWATVVSVIGLTSLIPLLLLPVTWEGAGPTHIGIDALQAFLGIGCMVVAVLLIVASVVLVRRVVKTQDQTNGPL